MLHAQRLALHLLHEAAQHIAVVAETEARLLQQLVVEIGRRVVGIDSQMFITGGERIPPPQLRLDRRQGGVVHREPNQGLLKGMAGSRVGPF